jgi:signal transduction histidine kinase
VRNGAGTLSTLATNVSEAERCYVAYAAHELRSSIAIQRTVAEVALADPHADTITLREMGEEVVAACEKQERMLEALLTLARSEYGRLRREPVDLAATTAGVLRDHNHHGLTSTTALEPALTIGEPQLIERLVANLVTNAVRHNIPGGRIEVATYTVGERAIFTIANTGPVIPSAELDRLFRPFHRLRSAGDRPDGSGLGLTIVEAIATAHDATLSAHARTGGGLRVDIDFRAEAWPRREVAENRSPDQPAVISLRTHPCERSGRSPVSPLASGP